MSKRKRHLRQFLPSPRPSPVVTPQTRDQYFSIAHAADLRAARLRGALDTLHKLNQRSYLREIEDLRTLPRAHQIHKGRYLHINGTPARPRYLHVQSRMPWVREQVRPHFPIPEKTVVCIRRKTRRRVLFALSKTGRGGGRQRPARWTAKSYIRCK